MQTEASFPAISIITETEPSSMEKPMSLDVRRAQRGDVQAFERVYQEHVGKIYGLCLRMVRDSARAEELTQDAFVRAWQKIGSFSGRATFSTWLHRLTVNLVISAERVRQRERDRVEDTPGGVEHQPTLGRPSGLRMDLEQAIAQLPDQARRVFVLYQVEGYRHGEVAKFLGIAEGTSKAHLYSARQKLKESLQ